MWKISFSSFALCFFFFFLVTSYNNISTIDAFSIDILNRTCKKCAEEFTVSYDFCTSSLETIPISHVTNIHGLGIIGMELALANATNTIASIKNLLGSGSFDPFALSCLKDCLELYSDAIVALIEGTAGFLTEHYSVADVRLSAVMKASKTCEESFKAKKGKVSPLTNENYNLFQLCDIALCITHMISLTVPLKALS